MKFALIALIVAVAAESKTLNLTGAGPSPSTFKNVEPVTTDTKAKKSGVTTEKWEMTKDGVNTKF